jgi:hypothetical protein
MAVNETLPFVAVAVTPVSICTLLIVEATLATLVPFVVAVTVKP